MSLHAPTPSTPEPPTITPADLLAGKVVVITGAGTGIGAVCAQVAAAEGAEVLVADITGAQSATAQRLGPSVMDCQVDMRDEDQIEAMFATAVHAYGRVDVLINVAGNPGGRRGSEITEQEYLDLTSVHLHGTVFSNKHAARVMRSNGGGAIVNFSSVSSIGYDTLISPVYMAAKAGINSLTRSLAVQYGPDNIRVNAVAPGFTASEKNQAAPPEIIAKLAARSALGRAGLPVEQAHAAIFLASDRASFISGQTLMVDGGWSVRLA